MLYRQRKYLLELTSHFDLRDMYVTYHTRYSMINKYHRYVDRYMYISGVGCVARVLIGGERTDNLLL